MDSNAHLQVRVVSADAMVWEGEAERLVVRTTEGDIGILPNHEPLLAALVPCVAEIIATDGVAEMIAVDGGFVSVERNVVSLLSQFAQLAEEIDVKKAAADLANAQEAIEEGLDIEDNTHILHRAQAQLLAAEHASKR